MNNSELQQFQSQVIREYDKVKFLFDIRKDPTISFPTATKDRGLIGRIFTFLVAKFGGLLNLKAANAFLDHPENIEYLTRARMIVDDNEVRSRICGNLNMNELSGLIELERTLKVVKSVSTLFADNEIGKTLEPDPKLYGYVVYEIFNKPIENYCKK